ncbi:MAG: hypothetical protein KF758_06355 [Anaerolineales bacterium]|nr:hypothetical protein [Anaerolineales bacterium]MBX3036515.1 hypothetical protein [Anaerolineales bacterium]
MKKYILIGLSILITACNLGTQPPTPESPATQTPLRFDELNASPSPIPVTATETFVLIPTPEPPPLYFTDEFTSASPYWEFLQTGGLNTPTTSYENDSLRIDISSPDTWMIGIHNAHTYNNVFIKTRANITSTGSFGLICRYNENGWYEFNIYSDGTYNLLYGKQLTEGIAKYIPLSTSTSGAITSSSEIGLHCQDNFLLAYVNGNLIRRIDVTNYGLGEGQVGISASSVAESPINIHFEWAKVEQD